MFSKRSIFSTVLLCTFVGFSSWWSIRSTRLDESNDHNEQVITYKATGIHLKQMNEQGVLTYSGTAKTFYNYSDDRTRLDSPVLKVIKPDQPAWTISADAATFKNSYDRVVLTGHVLISRPKDGTRPPLRIRTALLYLYPGKDIATTDDEVYFDIPHSATTMQAKGLRARLHPEQIELLSDVRSTYDPALSQPHQ